MMSSEVLETQIGDLLGFSHTAFSKFWNLQSEVDGLLSAMLGVDPSLRLAPCASFAREAPFAAGEDASHGGEAEVDEALSACAYYFIVDSEEEWETDSLVQMFSSPRPALRGRESMAVNTPPIGVLPRSQQDSDKVPPMADGSSSPTARVATELAMSQILRSLEGDDRSSHHSQPCSLGGALFARSSLCSHVAQSLAQLVLCRSQRSC